MNYPASINYPAWIFPPANYDSFFYEEYLDVLAASENFYPLFTTRNKDLRITFIGVHNFNQRPLNYIRFEGIAAFDRLHIVGGTASQLEFFYEMPVFIIVKPTTTVRPILFSTDAFTSVMVRIGGYYF